MAIDEVEPLARRCSRFARCPRDRRGATRAVTPEPAGTINAREGVSSPHLSVLIPCWNAASTIERALASALEAGDIDLECVVVDDGSDDGTADIVDAVARRDSRVVSLRLDTHEGVSAARNRTLAAARGAWLTFLDADDRLLPGAVTALMRPTGHADVLAVVGQRIWSNGERTWVSTFYDIPDIREPGRKSIATHPGLLYYVSATGKAFHRSLLDGLWFTGPVLGDQPWTIRALLRADDRIEVIGETVYEWSRPPDSSVATSITATTRASAERSAVAASIARSAFQEVAAEVDARIADEATRAAVRRSYAERLFRSDFGGALKSALERGDPAVPNLLDALAGLIGVIPPAVLRDSDALYRSLLRPPWDRWPTLPPAATAAYWRMLELVRRADPSVERRLLGSRRLVPLFRLARSVDPWSPTLSGLLVRGVRGLAARIRSRRSRGGPAEH